MKSLPPTTMGFDPRWVHYFGARIPRACAWPCAYEPVPPLHQQSTKDVDEYGAIAARSVAPRLYL